MSKSEWLRLAAEFQFASCVVFGDRKENDFHGPRGINTFIRVLRSSTVAELKAMVQNWIQFHADYIELIRCPELLEKAGFGLVVSGK
jgi:hypothetical protein